MTRSFARKLAPEIKVNAIAPSLIMFNEGDDAEYRQQALDKSLMKIAPGEKEIIDLIDYLFTSRYVTGRSFAVDGGAPALVEAAPAEDQQPGTQPQHPLRLPAPTAGA
jgi:dihydromonapterin reductase/dihydrofolate reductase